ncbi:MAG TPA: hypothetical protein VIC35_08860 [Acidimicrobiia bacterium]
MPADELSLTTVALVAVLGWLCSAPFVWWAVQDVRRVPAKALGRLGYRRGYRRRWIARLMVSFAAAGWPSFIVVLAWRSSAARHEVRAVDADPEPKVDLVGMEATDADRARRADHWV